MVAVAGGGSSVLRFGKIEARPNGVDAHATRHEAHGTAVAVHYRAETDVEAHVAASHAAEHVHRHAVGHLETAFADKAAFLRRERHVFGIFYPHIISAPLGGSADGFGQAVIGQALRRDRIVGGIEGGKHAARLAMRGQGDEGKKHGQKPTHIYI